MRERIRNILNKPSLIKERAALLLLLLSLSFSWTWKHQGDVYPPFCSTWTNFRSLLHSAHVMLPSHSRHLLCLWTHVLLTALKENSFFVCTFKHLSRPENKPSRSSASGIVRVLERAETSGVWPETLCPVDEGYVSYRLCEDGRAETRWNLCSCEKGTQKIIKDLTISEKWFFRFLKK